MSKILNSEEEYRTLIESLNVGVYRSSVDPQSRILMANSALANIFGYDSVEDIMQISIAETYLNPEDRNQFILELKQKGAVRNKELRLKKKDGTPFWASCTASIRHNGEGNVIWVEGIIADISEQRRIENTLKSSEKQYRNLVDNALAGIFKTNLSGDILYVNQALIDMLEFSSFEEMSSETVLVRYKNPGDRAALLEKLKKRGKVNNFECDVVCKNGVVKNTILNAVLENDTISGMMIDNSLRKQAEEKLKQSEEKYRTILENVEEGYFEVDLAGNFTFMNQKLCDLMGYAYHELIGLNNREYTNPETTKKMYRIFNRIYRTGEPADVVDYKVFRKDGIPLTFEMSASLMRGFDGRPIGFRGIARNVTERHQKEKEQKRIQAQLQQAEKLESISVLASGMTHDFNSLLTRIMGYIDIAQMDVPPGSELNHPLSEALRACERTKKLVRQFKALTQSSSPVKQTGPITKIVTSAVQNLFSSFNIKPELSFADNLWDLDFDENQIEKVLRNLLGNAAEASAYSHPNGDEGKTGAIIKITVENISIEATNRASSISPKGGNYVKITIQDQGVGISEENLPKIFDPYFSTKEIGIQKGMGLGLAVSFSIIKKHDGYIYVDSQEKIGTTVSVYLPASPK